MAWSFDPAIQPDVRPGAAGDLSGLLADLQAVLGTEIPPTLKSFLLTHPYGVGLPSAEFRPLEPSPWDDSTGAQSLDCFLGLSGADTIGSALEGVVGEVLPWLLPIGECPGGNYLCYGLAGEFRDRIWFWDHEHDGTERSGRLPGVYLVAHSLADFLAGLYPQADSDATTELGIVSEWFDADLLRTLQAAGDPQP
jgi:hypothetical protein